MEIVNLIISLVSGLVGGNLTGGAFKDTKNLGTLINSITGLLGGAAGGYLTQFLDILNKAGVNVDPNVAAAPVSTGSELDIAGIIANIVGGGAGGAILTAIATWIKNATKSA